jgi:hypothetical protein
MDGIDDGLGAMFWFGDPAQFALAVGGRSLEAETLRVLDVWVGGSCVTTNDNLVYIPQVQHTLVMEARSLANRPGLAEPFPGRPLVAQHRLLASVDDGSAEQFWFMHWGPTTDNCETFVFRFDSELAITCRNLDEPIIQGVTSRILEARVTENELVDLLLNASSALSGT